MPVDCALHLPSVQRHKAGFFGSSSYTTQAVKNRFGLVRKKTGQGTPRFPTARVPGYRHVERSEKCALAGAISANLR